MIIVSKSIMNQEREWKVVRWVLRNVTVGGCLIATLAAPKPARPQANNGAADSQNVMSVDFYRVPPGKQDEWLALYKKYHYPIMQYQLEHGLVLSEKVYTRATHELEPSWDFAIVIIAPPAGKGPKAEMTRGALIRHLFPNLDDYVKGEKERWSMTTAHWDERWTEVDVEHNPSLYYPAP